MCENLLSLLPNSLLKIASPTLRYRMMGLVISSVIFLGCS